MDVSEHLLARQHDAHGSLQQFRRHHREVDLILRAQAGAKCAADIRIEHPHLVFGNPKMLAI